MLLLPSPMHSLEWPLGLQFWVYACAGGFRSVLYGQPPAFPSLNSLQQTLPLESSAMQWEVNHLLPQQLPNYQVGTGSAMLCVL